MGAPNASKEPVWQSKDARTPVKSIFSLHQDGWNPVYNRCFFSFPNCSPGKKRDLAGMLMLRFQKIGATAGTVFALINPIKPTNLRSMENLEAKAKLLQSSDLEHLIRNMIKKSSQYWRFGWNMSSQPALSYMSIPCNYGYVHNMDKTEHTIPISTAADCQMIVVEYDSPWQYKKQPYPSPQGTCALLKWTTSGPHLSIDHKFLSGCMLFV